MVAFYSHPEQELSNVASILVSNVFASTLQHRSVWAPTRNQAFANRDDLEWK